MAINIVITDAGRAEVINADNTGTGPVLISEIGIGSGQYTADATQTVLQTEIKRITTFGGQAVADDVIHVNAQDTGTDTYQIYEFGLFTDAGTLFAVYSQIGTPILDKAATSIMLLAADIALLDLNATSLTFGDTNFVNPPATTTTQGVVELADSAETIAGTDTARAVTPAGLSTLTANTTRRGLVELATGTETVTGTDAGKSVTPAGLNSRTATDARTGLVELATSAETIAGTDSARVVTPAGLQSKVTQSATDATAGRLLKVGDFGLGGVAAIISTLDLNTVKETGFYRGNELLNAPTAVSWYYLVCIRHSPDYVSQKAISLTVAGKEYIRILINGIWSTWQEIYHTGNTGTAVTEDVTTSATDTTAGRLLKYGDFGVGNALPITDANLAVNSGFYSLPLALGALNAPLPTRSGSLQVINGGADTDYITQIWLSSNDTTEDRIFIRHRRGSVNGWTAWLEIMSSNSSATTTAKGVVELATSTETIAGTDATRAVTPAGIASAFFKRQLYGPLGTTVNFNDLTGHGTYHQASNGGTVSYLNAPGGVTGASRFILTVEKATSDDFLQIVSVQDGPGQNRQFKRHHQDAVWFAWVEIYNSATDGTGSGLDADLLDGHHVTQSNTDTVAGRVLKAGDINAVGGVDYRTPLSGGGITLAANQQYHIVDSLNYSLPNTSGLTPGASVVVTKSIYAAPTILTFGTEQIATDNGNFASLELSSDSETIFVWNATSWERVAVDDANGFTQNFASSGYQKLPSGLILQWGRYPGGETSGLITFPITFPSVCVAVSITLKGTSLPDHGTVTQDDSTAGGASPSSFAFILFGSQARFYWLAIGW